MREKICWTREVIKDVEIWVRRKHSNVEYFQAQFLTGHVCYLKGIGVTENSTCWYYEDKNTVRYTIFLCGRWDEERKRAKEKYRKELIDGRLIEIMLGDE